MLCRCSKRQLKVIGRPTRRPDRCVSGASAHGGVLSAPNRASSGRRWAVGHPEMARWRGGGRAAHHRQAAPRCEHALFLYGSSAGPRLRPTENLRRQGRLPGSVPLRLCHLARRPPTLHSTLKPCQLRPHPTHRRPARSAQAQQDALYPAVFHRSRSGSGDALLYVQSPLPNRVYFSRC